MVTVCSNTLCCYLRPVMVTVCSNTLLIFEASYGYILF